MLSYFILGAFYWENSHVFELQLQQGMQAV